MLLWFELLPSFLATCNGFYALLFVTFTKECKVESLSTFHVSAFIYVGVFDNVWISIGSHFLLGTFRIAQRHNLVSL